MINSLNENDKKEFTDFILNKIYKNEDYEKDFESEEGTISIVKNVNYNKFNNTNESYVNIVFYNKDDEICAEFDEYNLSKLQTLLQQ